MLLQTNSYVVPREKRVEHARLVRRFRQALTRLGCDQFEVYEQVGTNWSSDQTSGRFVQILRFRDRRQQLAVQAAERSDPACQAIIAEFCELINYPYQQQQGLFAIGYYSSVLGPTKALAHQPAAEEGGAPASAGAEDLAQAVPPTAQVIQFGEMPVGAPVAQEAAQQEVVAQGAMEESLSAEAPAEAPLFEQQPAGANGDTPHDNAPDGETPDEAASPAQAGAESLDELIKRRFGAVEITQSTATTDTPITEAASPPEDSNGEHVSPPPVGSGIGEVLNAVDDDVEFDFLLPGEPIDAASGPQHGADSHGAAPDAAQH